MLPLPPLQHHRLHGHRQRRAGAPPPRQQAGGPGGRVRQPAGGRRQVSQLPPQGPPGLRQERDGQPPAGGHQAADPLQAGAAPEAERHAQPAQGGGDADPLQGGGQSGLLRERERGRRDGGGRDDGDDVREVHGDGADGRGRLLREDVGNHIFC